MSAASTSAPVPATNGAVAPAAASSSSSAAASSSKPAVQASEVGWLFVPQYYTFLNQNPGRLHCFYTKKSTLLHGTEQETSEPCFGQQQIHDKITSLGFEDAKVFVSNVDSQSSASGGILIQVLGEMSNKGGPWRKFAQTFFLAEQPNGYYVLNDIFRYLKDEDEVEQEATDVDEAIQNEIDEAEKNGTEVVHQAEINNIGQPGATPHIPSAKSIEAAAGPTAAIADAPTNDSVAAVDEVKDDEATIEEVKPQEAEAPAPTAERPKVNGTEATEATPDQVGVDKKVTTATAEEVAPAKPAGVAAAEQEAPAAAPAKSDASAPAPPKTWANLAASDVSRWGSTVSAEVKGVSSSRPAAAAAAAATGNKSAGGAAAAVGKAGGAGVASPASGAGQNHGHVFIKNVVAEHVQEASLRQALEGQFGPLKECSVIPTRACAFAEFANAEHARKAVAMSLPTSMGGQGGIVVGKDRWKVVVEEKKKPADRPQGGRDGPRAGGPGGARGGAGAGRGAANGGRGGAAGGRGGAAVRRGGAAGN
ncbi:uncharacterized protein PFL1_04192 [Pseudozyma flocculosa PF-1]|uniref:NTF2 domain-containing protein n=1 Tax=Pseudozyma flocculosa PF-1 TaxID=1277687 RepID=A0A061H8M4_9BASI|nr:uncharacterized protein PFL1_04192 [Pseudozyma flocculosa PF-1]EPQ28365.1 hypothetical protein PFL1_04192 [Pseudozyma flocculosa PF-1]